MRSCTLPMLAALALTACADAGEPARPVTMSTSPAGTPLTAERIRQLMAEKPRFDEAASGPRGQAPLQMPEVRPGRTALDALAPQLDSLLGPGAGAHIADMQRLVLLMDLLTRGTIAEARARLDEDIERAESLGVFPAELLARLREQSALHAQRLAAFQPSEVDAVLASLDVLEPVFPDAVAMIRSRHSAG